ncbi:MAG: hypothetical protein KUL83_00860 [Lentimicrobium sp.]|nr:hypothetical protein [Lentimicrobium sp.]
MGKLYTVFLQYSSDHTASAISYLTDIEKRLQEGGTTHRILVDNKLPVNQVITEESWTIHGGDNDFHEFSGWSVGLNLLKEHKRLTDDDVILFVNDSFFRNYHPAWLEDFKRRHTQKAMRRRLMIGWMDVFPKKMEFLGYSSSKWIRTNCFLINYSLLRELTLVPEHLKADLVFSHSPATFFREDAPLGDLYRAYLRGWLFGLPHPGLKFRTPWYKNEQLNEGNLWFFEGKALSIMCEHALSAAVLAAGGRLMAINSRNPYSLRRIKKKLLSYFHRKAA